MKAICTIVIMLLSGPIIAQLSRSATTPLSHVFASNLDHPIFKHEFHYSDHTVEMTELRIGFENTSSDMKMELINEIVNELTGKLFFSSARFSNNHNSLIIKACDPAARFLKVYDEDGRNLFTSEIGLGYRMIQLDQLIEGTYIIVLIDASNVPQYSNKVMISTDYDKLK